MNHTTNYNFNVPVGSDIVNPLVQDFPNWETLDTILKTIANTGITTAIHTKTGTIHALTFDDSTVPMIRFQATADFNSNDTFTVNGLSVSALTVSGEGLPDGSFVIGSMVLCELRDNLLTVYTSGTDAGTLEGHPASYFATAANLTTTDNKANANRTLIDNLETDVEAIETKLNGSSFLQATAASGFAFNTQSANGFPQSGNNVTAYYSGSWTTGKSITPNTILATIPSSIRPKNVQYVMGYYSTPSHSDWIPCVATIRPDGTITIAITNANVGFILICGAYGI